jgi:hypothetical protein
MCNMKTSALAMLAAVMLAQPVRSVAGDSPADSREKPASFVPHSHTNHHVYGSPIAPPIVGHSKTSHHKHAPKKIASGH